MSGRVGHRKRLICVNAANLRGNHLYLTGHTDFFPADCYGSASKGGKLGRLIARLSAARRMGSASWHRTRLFARRRKLYATEVLSA